MLFFPFCYSFHVYLYANNKLYQYFFFLNIIPKIFPTSYFVHFGHVWPLPSKTIMPTCGKFDVYLHAKNELSSFLRYYKDIENLLLLVLWECLIMPINSDSINLQQTLKPEVFICNQKMDSLLFWHIAKILKTCYFECFENAWSCPSIMIVSPCRKLWYSVLKSTCRELWRLSACKKWTSSLTYFLKYCKDIANLLFYEFWERLSIPIKNNSKVRTKRYGGL